MFVTSVCTGCSTISRTPTAAARWYTTSQRWTSSLTTDDFSTESTTRWKSRRSRSCATFRSEPVERSSRTKTSVPCSSRRSARCEPMNPAPPVISALRPGASTLMAPDPRCWLLRRCQHAFPWGNPSVCLEYVQAMRSRLAPWLAVLTLTAAGAAAAAGYGLTAPKRYRATAQLLVSPVSPSDATFAGIGVLRDTGGTRTAAASAAALLSSPQIVDAAAAQLGLKRSRESLLGALDAHVVGRSDVVAVTAEDTSPAGAAQLANTFANVLIAQRSAAFQSELAAAIKRDEQLLATTPAAQRSNDASAAIARRLATLRGLEGEQDPTIRIAGQARAP